MTSEISMSRYSIEHVGGISALIAVKNCIAKIEKNINTNKEEGIISYSRLVDHP
jgi:hypothetical protein